MKKFKIISLAAALIIAATATTVSATSREEEVKLTEFEEQLLCGTYFEDPVSEEEQALIQSQWNSAKLLKEGVIDFVPMSGCDKYEDELNAIIAAEQSAVIQLTKNKNITAYTQWEGRFTVDDLAGTTLNFKEPAYFSIKISDGKNATMTSAKSYTLRYKRVTAYARYQSKDKSYTVVKTSTDTGNKEVLEAFPATVKDSTLVETIFYFYVYSGDDDTTKKDEVAMVHLIDSTYATSAQYAENPYAHLIDQYTHIEN
ncbi:MAG: hypothetical protein K2J80_05130 [Oscillospiraceae bacterium]|nr:hypothetical protein [Oscillospiraceae bacterium]